MSPLARTTLETVLRDTGFRDQDRPLPGLYDRTDSDTKSEILFRYRQLLMPEHGALAAGDLVYEVPNELEGVAGTPSICFKVLEDPTPEAIAAIRKTVWNHGKIPTLWIVSPDRLRIYNSFARPRQGDDTDATSHLLKEVTEISKQLPRLREFHKQSFDTGSFWQSGPGKAIRPSQRVDSALHRDLVDTKGALEHEGLDPVVAQMLLGRAVFVQYLEDRRILQASHFRPHSGATTFRDTLSDLPGTYSFFDWLQETFRGDLFPLTDAETASVTQSHLGILTRFLAGHNMARYPSTQARLWPYSFETVPIELISSIYEQFAHGSDPSAARARSVHYTRLGLVDLVLGVAMQGLEHDAKVLDPACGSGVFLVEAFRRLARMKEQHHNRALTREELHQLVRSQVFGLDIDRQAVYLAAFSLYLAILELDPDPHPPDVLALPTLLESTGADTPSANLHAADFFDSEAGFNRHTPFIDGGFDLIVGNPPWKALSPGPVEADGASRVGLEYCRRMGIPHNKPDQAFTVRAEEFSSSTSKIAFVMGSRVLYQASEKGSQWRKEFLRRHTVSHVVNLSDLNTEKLLFGRASSASQPATVIVYSPRTPDRSNRVLHIAPKWHPGVKYQDELTIDGADIQWLPQHLLTEHDFLWKTAFRGTPRDYQLLVRLGSYPTLEDVLTEAGIEKGTQRTYGVTFGRRPTKSASMLLGLPYLTPPAGDKPDRSNPRYRIDPDRLPPFDRSNVAKKSNRRALSLPVLVLHRPLQGQRPSVSLVSRSEQSTRIVLHRNYGVSLATAPSDLGPRLNAVLNSDVVAYAAFFLSSTLGWERPLVEAQDWLKVPLPPSLLSGGDTEKWSAVLELERWLRRHWHPDGAAVTAEQQEMDRLVRDLYGLTDQDSVLIRDTLCHNMGPLVMGKHKRATALHSQPTLQALHEYADRVCRQLDGVLTAGGVYLYATIVVAEAADTVACRFTWGPIREGPRVEEVPIHGIGDVLRSMSESVRSTVGDYLHLRRELRVYDLDAIWIMKHAQARLWSQSAALNDADAVLREHMEAVKND